METRRTPRPRYTILDGHRETQGPFRFLLVTDTGRKLEGGCFSEARRLEILRTTKRDNPGYRCFIVEADRRQIEVGT